MATIINKVKAGKHPLLDLSKFSDEEKKLIDVLAIEWYVTCCGVVSTSPRSTYKYALIKPTEKYSELFNFELEIAVCFSDYTTLEPRTLDAYELVYSQNPGFRIEKTITILLSKDNDVRTKLQDILKKDQEYQIIIPFSYKEILENKDSFFIRNRFKEFFYSRDLFSFQNPLTKDFYFFGRKELIHNIVSKHNSNENSGLFGLRKTGKTSIVYGIQRVLKNSNQCSVYIDCQDPSFHKSGWNRALWIIINKIKEQNNIECKIHIEQEYTEVNASSLFVKDITAIYKKAKSKILIIFDEVEHITYNVSPSNHWHKGNDSLYFWQALRSAYQSNIDIFTYLIVGTNPKCVEIASINGTDNPIFNQIPYQYIPSFDVSQTKDMVNKLGGIMGLKFDDIIYGKLTDDFGGHPFLIRLVCSQIHQIVGEQRPARVDKSVYEQAVVLFNTKYGNYIEMVINVLKEYYSDEYEMLRMLAIGDITTFNEFAATSREYTNHLLGYNILDMNNESYTFKIEAIRHYLELDNRYTRIKLSQDEKRKEISERRNIIEPKLRIMVRQTLTTKYGQNEAKQKILSVYGGERERNYYSYSIKDIFDPNKTIIYFEDLKKIISKYWDDFKHLFGSDQPRFNTYMSNINKYRVDAHAKDISDDEMSEFRVSAKKIEQYISDYFD